MRRVDQSDAVEMPVPDQEWGVFQSPVGRLGLCLSPKGLREVRWLRSGSDCPEGGSRELRRVCRSLERYFRSGQITQPVDLDLSSLSPFRLRVTEALLQVPPGQIISYAELAGLSGKPGAARAVGTVMAKNPLPIFVPCHRVVAAAGPGGFGPGLETKRFLLGLEGVDLEI